MSYKIVQAVEKEFMQSVKALPDFEPGDTVVVQVKVKEGERVRLQSYEGVVIAKRNRGYNSAFTVRKISHGVGVERVFQSCSPSIDSVTVKRRGDVRRAKLYYMRDLSGRAARIKEKLTTRQDSGVDLSNDVDTAAMPVENDAPETAKVAKKASAKAATAKAPKAKSATSSKKKDDAKGKSE